MSTIETTTTTQEGVELNLEEILGTPGASSIMLPAEEKPNLFTSKQVDTSFLNEPITKESTEGKPDPKKEEPPAVTPAEVAAILDDKLAEDNTDQGKSTGRPKVDKNGVVELTTKLIEKGLLKPFDEDKPLEEYTLNDFQELMEANFQEHERSIKEQTPKEFFESLPQELQYAYKYVADGGQDLKGLFKALATAQEVRELDPSEDSDQENIVRSYLYAKSWGTPEEIEKEITKWKDREELAEKASQFKPKLDALHQQVISQRLAREEALREQREQEAKKYVDSVYKVLEPAELNGLKLDKKVQAMLYTGLTQSEYPSISGRQTNMLGHLLEKHQFVEPNHALIAEALWLLADPDGYKEKVRESATKATTEKHVRMLKTEQSNKHSSTITEESGDTKGSGKKNAIPRPSQNFFKR
jgi:hypothetical protein